MAYSKEEVIKYLNANSLADQDLTTDDVTDDIVSSFNDLMDSFTASYPQFDIDSDDYEGEVDDAFYDKVMKPIGKKIGVNLVGESRKRKPINRRRRINENKKGRLPSFDNFT